jgi:FkbM family methyltransferase
MLKRLIRDWAVGLFALAAKLGVQRIPMFDSIFLTLYATYKQHLEAGPADRLREFVPVGSLAIDVGANVGFFTILFAEWVGATGQVVAIEPEPRNFHHLNLALERSGLAGHVRALQAVAAAAAGTTFLEINHLHPADHKISRDGTGLAVQAVKLDDLIADPKAARPSLIKIDVQGAEMIVLEGAGNILEGAKPALFVELHEAGLNRFGSSVTEVFNYLSQFGYEAYWLTRAGPHTRASQAEIRARAGRDGYVDVLFVARS